MKLYTIEGLTGTQTTIETYEARTKVEAMKQAIADGIITIKEIHIA